MPHRFPWAFVTLRSALVGKLFVATLMILGVAVAAACTALPQTEAPSPVARVNLSLTFTAELASTDTPVPSDTPAPTETPIPTSMPLPTHTSTPIPGPSLTPTDTPSLEEIAAEPNTVTVCADGCDFTTIQAAIDDPGTLVGDVIYVTDAIHTEAGVVVNKDVMLRGRSADQTTVQAHERAGKARDRVFFIPKPIFRTLPSE
jgi:pectin methylesterase-like acyl-CoA thioesterase